MQAIIQPSKLSGTITAPASKSAMQRACAAALLKGGKTVLHNPGVSDDDKAALDIIQQLGAKVEQQGENILITSNGVHPVSNEINCGESGLSVRMFTSIAALSDKQITINGRGSLVKRPLSFFNEVLPQLGVQCESNNGLLPLKIKGPLQPKNIEVDGSLSSQFLTGLLFAYSAADARDISINVRNLNSKPYIDLTLETMLNFCLPIPVNNDYQSFYFREKKDSLQITFPSNSYYIEGDWSGGAFLLVAGAVAGDIVVEGLNVSSTQADKAILKALIESRSSISFEENRIRVRKSNLEPFHFDATDAPDLFPPLVALASHCDGVSVIKGVHRLTHKESNRALTLQEEFAKLGVPIEFREDSMIILGGGKVLSATVSSRHDHRIAMACAVAALKADDEVIIDDAEAVNKSYPQFWEDLQKLKGRVSLKN